MFWCEVDGLDELERAGEQSDTEMRKGVLRAVTDATNEGAAEAKATHVYQDRTGNLSRSTKGRVIGGNQTDVEGVIEATMPYASFVDGGTAPHEIHAKNVANLKFKIGDRWVSTPSVHHPGTKPDAFMGRAMQKAERVLLREGEVAADVVVRIMES